MDCREIQDWVLQWGATPPEGVPAEVAEHLRSCRQCAGLAARIAQVEQAVRDLPDAPQAHQAKQRFLQKIQTGPATPVLHLGRRIVTRVVRWQYAAAAMVLLAAGAALWTLVAGEGNDAQAATVVERLVDWNLEMASMPTVEERKGLYATQAPQLQKLVDGTAATSEDGALARSLLRSGAGFCGSSDPLVDAEIFSTVADVLAPQVAPAGKPNAKVIKRRANLSARIEQKGVIQRLEKVESSGKVEGERAKRLEKVIRHNDRYQANLTSLIPRVPESDRREIRRALAASKYPLKARKTHKLLESSPVPGRN
jgi:hypothetical protein